MTPALLIGWPLLPLPDATGSLDWPTLELSVAQQIRVILQTRPGEQLMRPQWGAGLENFLQQPNTLATQKSIQDTITTSLALWEKRIVVDDVAVATVPADPTQVRVQISYRIRLTGVSQSLGLTIDLGA